MATATCRGQGVRQLLMASLNGVLGVRRWGLSPEVSLEAATTMVLPRVIRHRISPTPPWDMNYKGSFETNGELELTHISQSSPYGRRVINRTKVRGTKRIPVRSK